MKIALVHDYLTQRAGAERVSELLCKRYPDADIFTSLYDAQKSIDFGKRIINTTFLKKFLVQPNIFGCWLPYIFLHFVP